MKRWLITILLACCTAGLGAWAWHTTDHRGSQVIFGTSGSEAVQWAEKAKQDRRTELVTIEFVKGEITYRAVPHHEIDDHVQSNSNVLVRRWLPRDEVAEMTGLLSQHGWDIAQYTRDVSKAAVAQKSKTTWLMFATIIAGFSTVMSGIIVAKRSHNGNFR